MGNFNQVKRMEAKIEEKEAASPFLSFGFGIPMSRVYAQYWGGDIAIQSLPGYGVDAYLSLPRLGTMVIESVNRQNPANNATGLIVNA